MAITSLDIRTPNNMPPNSTSMPTDARSHVANLPSEMMAHMAAYLPIKDICKFRRTCRWAEKQTFKEFSARGYQCVIINSSTNLHALQSLEKIVLHSRHLAASVKTFTIRFYETRDSIQSAASRLLLRLTHVNRLEMKDFLEETFANFITPWLHQLKISSSSALSPALPERTRMAILDLDECDYMSGEHMSLLRAVGPTITQLRLVYCSSNDNHWKDIMELIRDDLPMLRHLDLDSLFYYGPDAMWLVCLRGVEAFGAFTQLIQGLNGPESISITYRRAVLVGAPAIKLGLDLIMADLAEDKDTYW